jgi:hypothetical protein
LRRAVTFRGSATRDRDVRGKRSWRCQVLRGDDTETQGTSPGREAPATGPGGPGPAVELFSRIERVSLHSKPLTNGTDVTSHEETWSSSRLAQLSVRFSATAARKAPLARTLSRPSRISAISEAASACQGRLRNGRVPFPGRQLQPPSNRPRSAPSSASVRPAPRRVPPRSKPWSSSTISSLAVVPSSRRKAAIFGASSSSPRER